jgi:dynactin 1
MSTFIGFVADALRDGDMEPGSDDQIWDKALSSSAHLSSAIPPILAASLEQENVKKVLGSQPWLLRVEDIKAEAAHNVDAERQIAKLKEELREALLQINAREQKLQEGAIKLERLQKQVDRTKEQADDLSRLTQELSETQRRLKEYQAVHESLQADLEASERKNATLTQASAKSAASTAGEAQSGERAGGDEDAAAAAGLQRGYSSAASFESGYLAEQLEATRNVLSVVRAENCYLKSAGMLQQLEALPVLPSAPLKPSNAEDDAEAGTPRPRRAAESSAPVSAVRESKTLYAELLRLAASPRVITLPRVAPAPADGSAAAPVRTWRRLAAQPRSQLAAQQRERLELQARIERLADSVRSARRAPRGSDAAAGEGRQSADLLARLPTVPLLAQ